MPSGDSSNLRNSKAHFFSVWHIIHVIVICYSTFVRELWPGGRPELVVSSSRQGVWDWALILAAAAGICFY